MQDTESEFKRLIVEGSVEWKVPGEWRAPEVCGWAGGEERGRVCKPERWIAGEWV